ncbi:MAG: hypothetical protein QN183_09190 [Armatimonadota bacterium]|nr:hypothetical protein [Armatimonadota bacterium]MDR7485226.1 hypothetical protein [Armatimonadota bacterium]MDR7533995.1 hypothetical protein [Armatimonadota bacterium]MDR7536526.1 hypothetical protein [Armatimonadota bacterium]
MKVQFLYWEGCPSHEEALARLRQALRDEGFDVAVEVVRVETQEDAERLAFPGSPTIRLDGEDLQPDGVQARGVLTCRTYRTETGRLSPLPTAAMIRAALRRRTPVKEGVHGPGTA